MAIVKKVGEETVEFLEEENLIKVTIPIKIIRRGSKSTIKTPDGMAGHEEMEALQIALIQGHRWIKMVESSKYKNLEAIAKKGENRQEPGSQIDTPDLSGTGYSGSHSLQYWNIGAYLEGLY